MQAEDRVIHFSVELVHAPVPLDTQELKKLYVELSDDRHASYDSTDFTLPAQPRFYSRRGKKTQSLAIFLPDRLVLVEEWADIPLSDFLERVRIVGQRAAVARGVQQFIAHTATIRSTFALSHYKDARIFLLDHAMHQEGKLNPHLQRPIAVGGIRFVLPETNEHPGTYHVVVESFRHSRDEIFVEVKGVFGRKPIGIDDMQEVLEDTTAVRRFIASNIYSFLSQYDQPGGPGSLEA